MIVIGCTIINLICIVVQIICYRRIKKYDKVSRMHLEEISKVFYDKHRKS